MKIEDEFRDTFKDVSIGTLFNAKEIETLVRTKHGRTEGSILPTAYCYNRWSKGLDEQGRLRLFEYLYDSTDDKKYKYLGENYPYSGKVFHHPKGGEKTCIGEYVHGMYSKINVYDTDVSAEMLPKDNESKNAWLLTWNPNKWEWRDLQEAIKKTKNNQKYINMWSCSNTHAQIGDRVFLTMLGTNKNGIFASGYVIKESFDGVHWDNKKAAEGKSVKRIGVEFDNIIDFETNDILRQNDLIKMFPEQKWNPQSSGIEIKKVYIGQLEEAWSIVCKKLKNNVVYPKNLILYGPPGTGKTYNTVSHAVAIVENKTVEEIKDESKNNRAGVLKRYNDYRSKGLIEFCTFHQSFGYEEFIEGIKPETEAGNVTYGVKDGIFKDFCKQQATDLPNNRVFIIDEINRGNISKIFGELITLIEESKRIGAEEEMRTRLPYSGDKFGVPGNVYLLGTMNTADRSIALLDTALRRRFKFEEMQPQPELLAGINVEGVNLEALLDVMNRRIEVLYDREHTIGHSFFMCLNNASTIEDLAEVFECSVIPLLKEYFYNDYERMAAVLGDDLNKNDEALNFISLRDNSYAKLKNVELDLAPAYKFNRAALRNPAAYQKIYKSEG